jgi:hypothetical protein
MVYLVDFLDESRLRGPAQLWLNSFFLANGSLIFGAGELLSGFWRFLRATFGY